MPSHARLEVVELSLPSSLLDESAGAVVSVVSIGPLVVVLGSVVVGELVIVIVDVVVGLVELDEPEPLLSAVPSVPGSVSPHATVSASSTRARGMRCMRRRLSPGALPELGAERIAVRAILAVEACARICGEHQCERGGGRRIRVRADLVTFVAVRARGDAVLLTEHEARIRHTLAEEARDVVRLTLQCLRAD